MTSHLLSSLAPSALDFELSPDLEAHRPPEAGGRGRGDVRLLVSLGTAAPVHARFPDLPNYLEPGDLLVVNRSATVAAALDAWRPGHDRRAQAVTVHLATPLPDGTWLIEPRQPAEDGTSTALLGSGDGLVAGEELSVAGGGRITVLEPFAGSGRLVVATLDLPPDVGTFLARHGHPIRYRHVPQPWPLSAYQTVFSTEPGSDEMPSAGRPFTNELVTRLVTAGVGIAPVVLHTGVSSLEGHETPYPERYRVPLTTADAVNATHRAGQRVVAVGTTVVRALETVAQPNGLVTAGSGWTDLVLGPERPARAVGGLVTGWHEPRSSHLRLLESIAPVEALEAAYRDAVVHRYRWHEFGDIHLLLP
jgi:S-adenosylmethionine:tRNA ribosyltransferase-isomerase